MTAPNTPSDPLDPVLRDPSMVVQDHRYLDAMEHNVRELRHALGLAGLVPVQTMATPSPREPGNEERHGVSGRAFAFFHGTAILFTGLTAICFGGGWALSGSARGRTVGAVAALIGLIGVFYGARRLVRLMHNPPIVTDADTST